MTLFRSLLPIRARHSLANAAAVAICGLSIGWLMGLSLSPTVQTVISTLLGLLISGVALLAGIRITDAGSTAPAAPSTETEKTAGNAELATETLAEIKSPKTKAADTEAMSGPIISIVPLAILCVTIAVGATLGGLARTNGMIGPSPTLFAWRWRNTGIKSDELQNRLFDTLFAQKAAKDKPDVKGEDKKVEADPTSFIQKAMAGGLYSAPAGDRCAHLVGLTGDKLRQQLDAVAPVGFDYAKTCPDDACLLKAKEALCTGSNE